MKTLFSIVYIPIGATLDERVSIGLLMSNGEHNFFRYSNAKLNAIKPLISIESHNILKSYLKSLEKEISLTVANDNKLFTVELPSKAKWVNQSYITYLSKYSNNLVQFSEPKISDVTLSVEIFKLFFEKYIYIFEEENIVEIEPTIFQRVRTKLYPQISGKVNIDKTVTSNDLANLFAPVEVSFIGMNNIPVAGQAFDFEKKHYFLENDLTRFISLTKALELSGQPEGKYFVMGKEPKASHNDKNHMMWSQIRETNFLEFVDIDDIGIVDKYIKQHNVKPFFEENIE